MCDTVLLVPRTYSQDVLRSCNVGQRCPLPRKVRKRLFSLAIWSPRHRYGAAAPAATTEDPSRSPVKRTNPPRSPVNSDDPPRASESSRDDTAIQDGDGKKKAVTDVTIGVMNCQSMCNKLDFIFDHVEEYGLDIVALTETWLSNQEPRNKSVIDQCEAKGYILHHIPISSGRKRGGVGILLNNRIKLVTRLVHVNTSISSFESIEAVITICSISIRLAIIYRMPPTMVNGIKIATFCEEFSDYLEKLSCASGNVLIVGDFNIDFLDSSDYEYNRFINILNTFDFTQHVSMPTHNSGHLLDYVITRRDNNLLTNIIVSDFISDHRVLHASLTCQRPHPARKQIQVRALRRINDVSLNDDLAGIEVDTECGDVNTVAIQYDDCMRKLLDKHAPLKTIQVVERPMNDWINDDILALKIKRRRNESLWRRTRLTIHYDLYKESCMAVKKAISESKSQIFQKKINECHGDQKFFFEIVDTMIGRKRNVVLPKYDDPATLASVLNTFFIDKINKIRAEFPLLESNLPPYSFTSMDSIMPECNAVLDHFDVITEPELVKVISGMHKTTCGSDPFPIKLLMDHQEAIIDTILHIVNLSLTTGVFPTSYHQLLFH